MAELCIRLAWQAGLTRPQIHALTWNQISFEAAEIRLPSHTIPIHPDLLECLEDRRNRPRSQASEYVVLTDARHTHPHEVHIAKAVSAALPPYCVFCKIYDVELEINVIPIPDNLFYTSPSLRK